MSWDDVGQLSVQLCRCGRPTLPTPGETVERIPDVIGDCFGGVALGGIACAYAGLRWVGVELEERFCALAGANIALHRRPLTHLGCPLPVIVRGDSRQFAAIVREALGGCVTSPPYAESLNSAQHGIKDARRTKDAADIQTAHYGTTPGQIGALPAGALDAAVTSPPYAEILSRQGEGDRNTKHVPRNTGDRPGVLHPRCYSADPANIGNLPAGTLDGAVTSPPYEQAIPADGRKAADLKVVRQAAERYGRKYTDRSFPGETYGTTPGQVGKESGESYWQAVAQVYAQVRQALRPGGCFVLVVKDYVSKKKRVPLCDQTVQLLTRLGFEVFLRCRCWLVKETRVPSLFGGDIVETTERKSFFRRLAEKKGSPRIDWEEVIFARKESSL